MIPACRVYKTTDPRSYIVRKTADEVFKVLSPILLSETNIPCSHFPFRTGKDQLLETAMVLHDLALNDEYFIKRNLYPNVDFWRYVTHVIYPFYPCLSCLAVV